MDVCTGTGCPQLFAGDEIPYGVNFKEVLVWQGTMSTSVAIGCGASGSQRRQKLAGTAPR
eukprot:NODE_11958_length_270_cov_1.483721.p2 GENE.NODE_11958_length_270_cov_1.483721~~NODE_11958_length_270_cov_1.483721.p2  ORF type:complete len:60 (+),score=9.83 NODE_11958_length_270_cov_1.483721:77-256(+)